MPNLNDLTPSALSAAMRGGTVAWGKVGSASENIRYAEPIGSRSRRRCQCGCNKRATHLGMANGIGLMPGCELRVKRWVRDGK